VDVGSTKDTDSTLLETAELPQGVREIRMRDPAGRNALDESMRGALRRAMTAAYSDPAVRAIVLSSACRNFSVGGDVAVIGQLESGQGSHARMTAVGELVRLLGQGTKPLVAAVTGHCVGAGAGLALLCDTIILGRSGSIGFPFLKIGVVPDFGISYTLARRIGPSAARQALLYAKAFAADDALKAGLVDDVVADEEVRARAQAAATQLACMPAYALSQVRQMLRQTGSSLDACLEAEALHQALCFGSADLKEGIDAFRSKRAANFVAAGYSTGSAE
jgi:2-(1,2-epoxy-1,2-dihydrophenyl)acetyl-CoA isomerase